MVPREVPARANSDFHEPFNENNREQSRINRDIQNIFENNQSFTAAFETINMT